MAVLSGALLSGEAANRARKDARTNGDATRKITPAPIFSRFLCPRPPMLLRAPNQNRHATQAMQIYKMVSPETGRAEEVVTFEKF